MLLLFYKLVILLIFCNTSQFLDAINFLAFFLCFPHYGTNFLILKTLHSTGLESLGLVQFKTEVTPVIMGNDISFLGLRNYFFQSFFLGAQNWRWPGLMTSLSSPHLF